MILIWGLIEMKKRLDNNEPALLTIHIDRIAVDSNHIRKNSSDISGLKSTISDVGLLQPILARQTDRGYAVIDGTRRLQALKELGVKELIIGRDIIVEASETEADEAFKELIANLQREDINDIELGHAFFTLKEKHGYQYNEISEIIGKTPHYVTAKVGLARRLTAEVQAIVISDWSSAKCCRTAFCDEDHTELPYSMNVNVIEDIARLPGELQKTAYETIKEKQMDKKEAMQYLRSIKKDLDVLQIADDAKGLMRAISEDGEGQLHHKMDVRKYIQKLDKDIEQLSETFKTGHVDPEELMPGLESLIERLNMLYSKVKEGKENSRALVSVD
jgi:ParB family chromosome partitioning protein